MRLLIVISAAGPLRGLERRATFGPPRAVVRL